VEGDRIKEVDYGGTVDYNINIINTKSSKTDVNLELTNVPDHWSATLSDKHFSLEGNSNRKIILKVQAPSMYASDESNLVTVAQIGVRSENKANIRTITILKGTTIAFRDDDFLTLGPDAEVKSGDLIATIGNSEININWSSFYDGAYEGSTSILLDNCHAAILYHDEKVHIAIQDGNVIFKGEGFGGGKAEGNSPVIITQKSNSNIIKEFPGFSYSAILILDPSVIDDHASWEDAFFSFSINQERIQDNISVEVFEGELEVSNEYDSSSLRRFETTIIKEFGLIPDATTIERIIVTLETDEAVEGILTSGGENVFCIENSKHTRVGNKEVFIIDADLLDIQLELNGRRNGNYIVNFTTVEGHSAKSYEMETTASLDTSDTFRYATDNIELRNMELGKSYDLKITIENLITGEVKQFTAVEVKTIEVETGFIVEDWQKLDDLDENPVLFFKKEETVEIHTGMSGIEIYRLLATSQDEEKSMLRSLLSYFLLGSVFAIASYQFHLHEGQFKDVIVDEIRVNPQEPMIETLTQITAVIRNEGISRKGTNHTLSVTFYENFVPLTKENLDLMENQFRTGETREITIDWTPTRSGRNTIHVAVDVDDVNVDTKWTMVHGHDVVPIPVDDKIDEKKASTRPRLVGLFTSETRPQSSMSRAIYKVTKARTRLGEVFTAERKARLSLVDVFTSETKPRPGLAKALTAETKAYLGLLKAFMRNRKPDQD